MLYIKTTFDFYAAAAAKTIRGDKRKKTVAKLAADIVLIHQNIKGKEKETLI